MAPKPTHQATFNPQSDRVNQLFLNPSDDLHQTAIHEAGHAVIAVRHDITVDHLTIVPANDALGLCVWGSLDSDGKSQLGAIRSTCAGGLGKLAFGIVPLAEIDLADAESDLDTLGNYLMRRYDSERRVNEIIGRALQDSYNFMVTGPRVLDEVRRVAATLLTHGTIGHDQVVVAMQERAS